MEEVRLLQRYMRAATSAIWLSWRLARLYTRVLPSLELLSRYLSSTYPVRPLSWTFLSRDRSSSTRISRVCKTSRPWLTHILSSQCRECTITGRGFCSALSVVPVGCACSISLVDHSLKGASARKNSSSACFMSANVSLASCKCQIFAYVHVCYRLQAYQYLYQDYQITHTISEIRHTGD